MTPTTPAGYFLYKDDRNAAATAATAATADAEQHIGKHKNTMRAQAYIVRAQAHMRAPMQKQERRRRRIDAANLTAASCSVCGPLRQSHDFHGLDRSTHVALS